MRGKKSEIKWEDRREKVVRLIEEIPAWEKEGNLPDHASEPVRSFLQAKQKRFRRKGIQIRSSIIERDGIQEPLAEGENKHIPGAIGKYGDYRCIREWSVLRNEKPIFQKKEQDILSIKFGASQEETESITEYYYQRDDTTENGEILNRIMQWVMLGIIFGLVYVLCIIVINNQADLALILTAPAVGGIIGYVLVALKMSGSFIRNAVRTVSTMRQNDEAKVQATLILENFCRDFRYKEFEKRMLFLVYRVLLTDDIEGLGECEQEVLEGCLKDIVDAVWGGIVEYEGYYFEEPHCELKMKVHMIDTYVTGKSVFQRKDVFHITMYKNLQEMEDWIIRTIWREQ